MFKIINQNYFSNIIKYSKQSQNQSKQNIYLVQLDNDQAFVSYWIIITETATTSFYWNNWRIITILLWKIIWFSNKPINSICFRFSFFAFDSKYFSFEDKFDVNFWSLQPFFILSNCILTTNPLLHLFWLKLLYNNAC